MLTKTYFTVVTELSNGGATVSVVEEYDATGAIAKAKETLNKNGITVMNLICVVEGTPIPVSRIRGYTGG